jgi:NADPH2:quinone reductase
MNQTMKAAVVMHRGPAEFELESRPIPEPGPGEVLVRVHSASVNFSDVKRRRGDPYPFETEFPFVPGGEIAGTVEKLGPGVERLSPGMRVLALAGPNGFGGYAQYALSYAQTAVPLPDGLGFDEASTLLVAGTTAGLILSQAAVLRPGESILVPSAAGGVGSFLVQMAKAAGASPIIALVGDRSKAPAASGLGADVVLSTEDTGWANGVMAETRGKGVDVALEAEGGDSLERTLACLTPFGRLVVYGAASGVSARLGPEAMDRWLYTPAANQSITGFNVGNWFMLRPDVAGRELMNLMTAVLEGRIRIPPITTLPLQAAAHGHALLESRRSRGKIVLNPWA